MEWSPGIPQTPALAKIQALPAPEPEGLNPAGIHQQTRAASLVLHLICASLGTDTSGDGSSQPWDSNIQELSQRRFVTNRVCGTSGAQECETGTGDSPRALFPLTAAVILGAWRNGERVCRGQLDPGKKEMCFSLRKIQQHCSLIGKRPGFVFLVVIFFLSWRSSDTLQHFKVFPENEEQPQPCQEQLVSHHG